MSGKLRRNESANIPLLLSLSRTQRFFIGDDIGRSKDTEGTTAHPWSASFSSTALFPKTALVDKNRRSTFAPRGGILRTAQVSQCLSTSMPPTRSRLAYSEMHVAIILHGLSNPSSQAEPRLMLIVKNTATAEDNVLL